MSNLDTDLIRMRASGSWLYILEALAPELEQVIMKPGKRHIDCPVHGGTKGFRLFRDAGLSGGGICSTCGPKPDGFSLLMWLRDWCFPEALLAVANVLGLAQDRQQKSILLDRLAAKPTPPVDDRWLKANLRSVWQASKPIGHPAASPVRLYLQNRGLDESIRDWPSLRFHPAMPYNDEDGKLLGHYPALLALVENAGKPVTIHRTFITQEGKKVPFISPKKLMGVISGSTASGAAICIGVPGRVLSVTEGIENALAIHEATCMVCWSLISASIMPAFNIPRGVEKLIIWADLDRNSGCRNAGKDAALALAGRASERGIEVEVRFPEGPIPEGAKSIDWLDVLNDKGPNGFSVRSFV